MSSMLFVTFVWQAFLLLLHCANMEPDMGAGLCHLETIGMFDRQQEPRT